MSRTQIESFKRFYIDQRRAMKEALRLSNCEAYNRAREALQDTTQALAEILEPDAWETLVAETQEAVKNEGL